MSYKNEALKKDNLTLKVVIELCKQKMTRKKVEELEKIAGLFVNNFKEHTDDSLKSITSIVGALESYITAPIATNIEA